MDLVEAIQRILGVVPAFFRPRMTIVTLTMALLIVVLAFGSYNDLVLMVAGSRGQSAVIWDLESAIVFSFYTYISNQPFLS